MLHSQTARPLKFWLTLVLALGLFVKTVAGLSFATYVAPDSAVQNMAISHTEHSDCESTTTAVSQASSQSNPAHQGACQISCDLVAAAGLPTIIHPPLSEISPNRFSATLTIAFTSRPTPPDHPPPIA